MKKLIGLLIGGLAAGAVLGYIVAFGGKPAQQNARRLSRPPVVGKEMPALMLEDLDGNAIDTTILTGEPLIINFWATWCPPCKAEMPLLQEFSRVNQESVVVIGINVMESNAVVKEYVQANKISFTILLDSDGRVYEAYQILGLPTTYFVDENGILRAQHIGVLDKELLNEYGKMIGLP
ncbi:MAG: TlpA family protein disulfide reductase [Anaerolineae bacterium]|nr:TlpA family protein disulfide reductase [Anaerolineae bacterium]